MYVLVAELNAELKSFIHNGITKYSEFHVLPEADEQEIVRVWTDLGYDIRYYRHSLKYARNTVTIWCLRARNPDTDVSISLIPWFIVPGRPFPIFAYIYAIWYYHQHGKKSLNEAAKASGILFKIESFHKSTVSRSIKALEDIIDIAQIDSVLAVSDVSSGIARSDKSCKDVVDRTSEILKSCPSVDSLKKTYSDEIKPLPGAINTKATIKRALSGIPAEHSQIVIHPEPNTRASRDTRKRPPRPREKKKDPVQHHFRFVEDTRREKIRMAFIENCRCLVLDAAIIYHRFLI